MKKRKPKKKSDPVARAMILRAAKAGIHPNPKRVESKLKCRKKISPEDWAQNKEMREHE
jgi:hypothetical protein